MDFTGLAAVLLIFGLIPVLVFLCAVVFAITGRRGSRKNRQQEEEEMRWMQQMNEGMNKIGDRVDALETLLMDRLQQPKERQESGRHES